MLYCCKLKDFSQNKNITEEFLYALNYKLSSWFDKEENSVYHIIYTDSHKNAIQIKNTIKKLCSTIWHKYGVKISEIEIFSLKEKDWTEVWKRFFYTQHITRRITVNPEWIRYQKSSPDEIVIQITPGMSFGTGKHPTTRFCLRILDFIYSSKMINSFLDAGCGSGILSVAAYKLGCRNITAIDIDKNAVETARENAKKNCLPDNAINFFATSLEEFNYHSYNLYFDLIIANILSHVLINNKNIIISMLKKNGFLVLSGILATEYNNICDIFQKSGCLEILTEKSDEWQSGLFVFSS